MNINGDPGTPWPPADGRMVLFLLDGRSHFEHKLLEDCIERTRPDDAVGAQNSWKILKLPPARQRHDAPPDAIWPALDETKDGWFVPLRVTWFRSSRNRHRSIRISDILFGDPRAPGVMRQRWIYSRHRERCRFLYAEPATGAQLLQRFEKTGEKDSARFKQYVIRQAILALERAERRERGRRYKVPRLVGEDILARASFRAELEAVAAEQNRRAEAVNDEAARYLKEMAANHRTIFLDLFAQFCRFMYTRGYDAKVVCDDKAVARISELSERRPLVLLFTHKSYLDVPVLIRLLYDNNFPPAHLFGGINMNIFGLGALMRRAGVVFIRRSFQNNRVYKLVFQHYIDYLVEKRFPLMWSIEGTRSRSGKLMEPRLGLLSYVVESCRRMQETDVALVPVSIAYDQIAEVGEFMAEQRGGSKKPEDVSWLMRYLTGLKNPFGRIFVRFGEPVTLAHDSPMPIPGKSSHPDAHRLLVQKIAFEVSDRINQVTPITATSLVTLTLLGAGQRALTLADVAAEVTEMTEWVAQCHLPTTDDLMLNDMSGVERTLADLAANGVVACFEAGPKPVFSIGPEQHLSAAYYRNTIIHFFVNDAFAELGLLKIAQLPQTHPESVFNDEIMALRDLFKFEFYYPPKPEFRRQVFASLEQRNPLWSQFSYYEPDKIRDLISATRPLLAHRVLRSFVDAYTVVAHVLFSRDTAAPFTEAQFLSDCLALGKQMYLQRRIASEESIAKALYSNGLRLARNRKLIEGRYSKVASGRRNLVLQLHDVGRRLDVVQSVATTRLLDLSA